MIVNFKTTSVLFYRLAVIITAFVFSAGCLTPAEPKKTKPDTNSVKTTDVLQVGDELRITLTGPSELEKAPPIEQKVKDDGTISLSLLTNNIKAVGFSTAELEQIIKTNYVPKFYKHLSVLVVAGNRFFYVDGQVRKPDRYPHVAELTVLKAIASAGGFNEFAKKSKVKLTRLHGKVENVDCDDAQKDPKLDLPIYPGDKVFVPRRFW